MELRPAIVTADPWPAAVMTPIRAAGIALDACKSARDGDVLLPRHSTETRRGLTICR